MRSKNVLLIVGTTVGAGIFSLPLAYRQVGILPFFVFLTGLSYVSYQLNVLLLEVVQHIKSKHQLPGYIGSVLGPYLGSLSLGLLLVSGFGAMIAFASIGGRFLADIIGLNAEFGTMLFYISGTAILFLAGKHIEQLDEVFAIGKGILFVLLIICAFLFFPFSTYHPPHLIGTSPYIAFGLIFFSLTGFSIIPELRRDATVHNSLFIAQLLVFALYAVFTLAMSPYVFGDSFRFQNPILDVFIAVTGFVSVFTTYLMFSLVTKDIFHKDLRFSHKGALGFTAGIPFIAIFFHFDGFLKLLSLSGGVFLAATGLLICAMHMKLFPRKNQIERMGVMIILGLGIVLELLHILHF